VTEDCFGGICSSCQGPGCFILDVEWDGSGLPGGEFDQPNALDLDASGNVYVVDAGPDRIQKFTNDGGFIASFPNIPGFGIAVDETGFFYVPNGGLVGKYRTGGDFVEFFSASGLSGAQGAAVDSLGNVYVTDSINDKVFVFDSDGDLDGDPFGGEGTDEGELNSPHGIAVGPGNVIWVADMFNHRIQKFDSQREFVLAVGKQGGGAGNGPGEFNSPTGVAVDESGNVYVADFGNDRIQIFDGDGEFSAAFDADVAGDGQLDGPVDVAVDELGNIFVADFINDRVLKFSPLTSAQRGAAVGIERKRAAPTRGRRHHASRNRQRTAPRARKQKERRR
jgi:DNA-binding beta-propeller fold protein YncE